MRKPRESFSVGNKDVNFADLMVQPKKTGTSEVETQTDIIEQPPKKEFSEIETQTTRIILVSNKV